MNPIVYLTAEVKHRDLEPRLEIAAHLLHQKVSVVIGQQWTIFVNPTSLPQGVILFKMVNRVQAKAMHAFHQAGHAVAATDEEVLNFMDEAGYVLPFGQRAAENCDLFFAQNEGHETAVHHKFPFLAGKTLVVGSPRVDVLSPAGRSAIKPDADEIARQHAPFVLFNTNFGSTNSIWGGAQEVMDMAVKTGDLNPDDPVSVAQFNAIVAWEQRNKDELTKLFVWAREHLKRHKIVLRPHPGEKIEYWREVAGDDDRVVIVPRSNPHPWLMACDLVVHTGCTTGLEAALLDRPALNVMMSDHPVSDRIVNWINPKVTSFEAATAAMTAFLGRGEGPIAEDKAVYAQRLEQHLPSYRENASARKIADGIVALLKARGADIKPGYFPNNTPGFKRFLRPDIAKDKFTVSLQEVAQGLGAIQRRNGLSFQSRIFPMDDSLFFVTSD